MHANNLDTFLHCPFVCTCYVRVLFDSTCLDGVCLFQPAIVNESTNYNFTFYDEELKPFDVGSMSLLFSATIISGMI